MDGSLMVVAGLAVLTVWSFYFLGLATKPNTKNCNQVFEQQSEDEALNNLSRNETKMRLFKAFKDETLSQGGRKFTLNKEATTESALVLRVSGIHACDSVAACKKYYPESPVIVECEADDDAIADSHDGVYVMNAITPLKQLKERVIDNGGTEARSPSDIAEILRNLADELESVL